jgi:hypothetical protein
MKKSSQGLRGPSHSNAVVHEGSSLFAIASPVELAVAVMAFPLPELSVLGVLVPA